MKGPICRGTIGTMGIRLYFIFNFEYPGHILVEYTYYIGEKEHTYGCLEGGIYASIVTFCDHMCTRLVLAIGCPFMTSAYT